MAEVIVIIGSQWGDEGKGKIVDLFAKNCDLVCRCQGGNNAGHTVIVNDQSYFFHLLPSGLVNRNSTAVIGNGVVVHLPSLFKEIDECVAKGLTDAASRLVISDRCHIVFDFHIKIDEIEEIMRGSSSIGTTKRGIGPAYAHKVGRHGLRIGDLVYDWDNFLKKYRELLAYVMKLYPSIEFNAEEELKNLQDFKTKLEPLVCDTTTYLSNHLKDSNKKILVEGAQSSLLDIDFGTYPYVTSSSCSIGGVCTGLGIPPKRITSVYGVMKAYTTRVGNGIFPTEIDGPLADHIREKGHEYGVTTKRPRRVGWLDCALLNYSNLINGFDAMGLTKLDILDELDEIKIATAYRNRETKVPIIGNPITTRGMAESIDVQYLTLSGWKKNTTQVSTFNELPEQAKAYIKTIESLIGIPIKWIGIGPGRESIIHRDD